MQKRHLSSLPDKEPLLSLYHIKFSYCKTAKHPQSRKHETFITASLLTQLLPQKYLLGFSPMVLFPCPFHSRGDCIRFTRISLFNSGHVTHPVTVIIMQLYLSFYSILHNVSQSVNAISANLSSQKFPKTVLCRFQALYPPV